MNALELLSAHLGIIMGIILVLYFLFKFIRILIPKAGGYLLKENGKFNQESMVKFNPGKNNYRAYDLNKNFADRQTGEIFVDSDGKAWVQVQKESRGGTDITYEKIGYIDLHGNVYDKNHYHVGYVGSVPGQPDMNGRRKWYELFLRCHAYVFKCARQEQLIASAAGEGAPESMPEMPQDQCIGKCIETGRFRSRKPNNYTVLGRAATFLLLYQHQQKQKPKEEEFSVYRYCWHDTALISAVLFSMLYAVFYLFNVELISMPFLGEWWVAFLPAVLYPVVWAVVRQVKIEMSLSGKPVEQYLMLFNRNTGLSGMNNLILLFAAAACIISFTIYGRDFVPVLVVILAGVFINRMYSKSAAWVVYERFLVPDPDYMPEEEDTEEMIHRNYRWDLDSDNAGLSGSLDLYFTEEEIQDLRDRNPFRTDASQGFDHNIGLLFREKVDERHLRRVNHYIIEQAYEAGLNGLDTMQFILDFVQEPNIKYHTDEESTETGGIPEYARFPVETLYDKRGDCDCKAVLAAALFRNAGYKVAFVTSNSHAAIAVACPKEWFSYYNTKNLFEADKQALIDRNGLYYYYCETTSNSFRIGDYGETISPEEFRNFIFLK
ncbi:MAG: hypothetical protein LBV74_03105 [Tannerella sp.]|jgi:hypothetical protein|nr:hypothetical protein [Tannerella sp.]